MQVGEQSTPPHSQRRVASQPLDAYELQLQQQFDATLRKRLGLSSSPYTLDSSPSRNMSTIKREESRIAVMAVIERLQHLAHILETQRQSPDRQRLGSRAVPVPETDDDYCSFLLAAVVEEQANIDEQLLQLSIEAGDDAATAPSTDSDHAAIIETANQLLNDSMRKIRSHAKRRLSDRLSQSSILLDNSMDPDASAAAAVIDEEEANAIDQLLLDVAIESEQQANKNLAINLQEDASPMISRSGQDVYSVPKHRAVSSSSTTAAVAIPTVSADSHDNLAATAETEVEVVGTTKELPAKRLFAPTQGQGHVVETTTTSSSSPSKYPSNKPSPYSPKPMLGSKALASSLTMQPEEPAPLSFQQRIAMLDEKIAVLETSATKDHDPVTGYAYDKQMKAYAAKLEAVIINAKHLPRMRRLTNSTDPYVELRIISTR
jgi:hypothetical protein